MGHARGPKNVFFPFVFPFLRSLFFYCGGKKKGKKEGKRKEKGALPRLPAAPFLPDRDAQSRVS